MSLKCHYHYTFCLLEIGQQESVLSFKNKSKSNTIHRCTCFVYFLKHSAEMQTGNIEGERKRQDT